MTVVNREYAIVTKYLRVHLHLWLLLVAESTCHWCEVCLLARRHVPARLALYWTTVLTPAQQHVGTDTADMRSAHVMHSITFAHDRYKLGHNRVR